MRGQADAAAAGKRQVGVVTVVAICTLAIGLGASIGFMWGFLATLVRDDLGLTRAQVGLLVSVYFGATGLGSVAAGDLTDRLGARWAVGVDLAVVAAAAIVAVLLPSYPILLLASVAGGTAYALGNAGTNLAIAAVVPLEQRAIALTVKTAGVPVMAVAGAWLGPAAGARHGWSWVMGVIAVLSALAMLLALVTLPEDRPAQRPDRRERPPLPVGFLWMPVAAFLLIAGTQPLYSWVVPHLEESLGLAPDVAGRTSSYAIAIGVVVMVVIARNSDRIGPERRLVTVALCMAVSALGLIWVAFPAGLGAMAVLFGTAIGAGAQLGAIGVMHAAVVDVSPQAVGRASGVTMTGYYLGALVAPAGFGAIIDATSNYRTAWLASLVAVVGSALAFHRASRVLRPAARR